jgi:hypothetical protein
MSESDQFRQYADEALLWVAQSKTEEEKRLLLELVLTWTEAAIVSAAVDTYSTGPLRAAISVTPERRGRMPRLPESKTFDTVDSAKTHAD